MISCKSELKYEQNIILCEDLFEENKNTEGGIQVQGMQKME